MNEKVNNKPRRPKQSSHHSNRRRRRPPRRNDVYPDDNESLEVISPDQLELSKQGMNLTDLKNKPPSELYNTVEALLSWSESHQAKKCTSAELR